MAFVGRLSPIQQRPEIVVFRCTTCHLVVTEEH